MIRPKGVLPWKELNEKQKIALVLFIILGACIFFLDEIAPELTAWIMNYIT